LDTSELQDAAGIMSGFPKPWLVAGGWAIDLYLGRATRPHKDVDIAIFREDQLALQRYLAGWRLEKVESGTLRPWHQGEYIQLPVHEIWAWRPASERGDDHPDLEFLLDECTAADWVFRRDPRIVRPLSLACLRAENGLPYLAPEIALLYKSKSPREDDAADFEATWIALSAEQRTWLRQALELSAPGHGWLASL
jgi:hypothetical protein